MWKFNLSEWMMGGSSEPPVVRFVRDFRTDGIEKVTLVGSSEDLGFWELDHGVAMEKVDDSKGLWSTPLLPVSSKHIEYKYAVKLAGKAKEEWFPSGPNKKLSEENLRKVTDREAVVDDTSIHTSFQLLVRNASPSQVRLVGSPPELGSWDLSKSKSLYQVKNKVWQTEVSFERSTTPFHYKFVCKNRDGEYEWEKDPNRNGDLSKTNEDADGVSLLWHSFNESAVRLVMYHKLDSGMRMCVVGGHPSLQNWDWNNPRPMELGPERELVTGSRGLCWETTFPIDSNAAASDVYYRYLAVDLEGTYLVENEPNRMQRFPDRSDGRMINGVMEIVDANFVPGLNFDIVPMGERTPDIVIGSYVQSRLDVDELKKLGVGAVLNLQTDEDISKRKVNLQLIEDCYRRNGIEHVRYAIRDNDPQSFIDQGRNAAANLNRLLSAGKLTYVHCTAGMGRAPSAVMTYLVLHKGLEVVDAYKYVVYHRTVATPSIDTIHSACAS